MGFSSGNLGLRFPVTGVDGLYEFRRTNKVRGLLVHHLVFDARRAPYMLDA